MKKLLVILLIGLLGIGGAIYGKQAYNAYQKEAQFQDAIARTVITPINEHWTTTDTNYGQMLWIKARLK